MGTSTTLFVAPCPGAPAPLHQPRAVTNVTEAMRHFGSDRPEADHLIHALRGFFQNGGPRAYVIATEDERSVIGDPRRRTGLHAAAGLDEPALVVCPGVSDVAAQRAVLEHCETMRDRFAVLDAPREVDDLDRLTRVATVDAPAAGGGDARAEGDGPPARPAGGAPGLKPAISEEGFGSLNFPWIVVSHHRTGDPVPAPPSGHVAGLYARTDARRGVHKAPANEVVAGALGLTYNAARAELGMLNRAGVNVIRAFPRRGIRLFGARTLGDPSSEWRYVNVRRFLIFVEESLQLGLMRAVFEPHDQFSRDSLRMQIASFLTLQWRDGALVGATPEEAFFVKCDVENNPPESVEAGVLRCDVGLAVVRPAEFVVVRLSQWSGGAAAA